MTTLAKTVEMTETDLLYEAKTAAEQHEHQTYRRHRARPHDSLRKREWEEALREADRARAVYIDALIREQAALRG
jgi:hypothetical protein